MEEDTPLTISGDVTINVTANKELNNTNVEKINSCINDSNICKNKDNFSNVDNEEKNNNKMIVANYDNNNNVSALDSSAHTENLEKNISVNDMTNSVLIPFVAQDLAENGQNDSKSCSHIPSSAINFYESDKLGTGDKISFSTVTTEKNDIDKNDDSINSNNNINNNNDDNKNNDSADAIKIDNNGGISSNIYKINSLDKTKINKGEFLSNLTSSLQLMTPIKPTYPSLPVEEGTFARSEQAVSFGVTSSSPVSISSSPIAVNNNSGIGGSITRYSRNDSTRGSVNSGNRLLLGGQYGFSINQGDAGYDSNSNDSRNSNNFAWGSAGGVLEGGISSTGLNYRSFDDQSSSRMTLKEFARSVLLWTLHYVLNNKILTFFFFISFIVFLFGVTDSAKSIVRKDGYNEIFSVFGSLFVFPLVLYFYKITSVHVNKAAFLTTAKKESFVWYWVFRIVLTSVYIVQQSFLLFYLIKYSDSLLFLLFLIPDISLLVMMVLTSGKMSIWTHIYIINTAIKMGLFWPNLDSNNIEAAHIFTDPKNLFGYNGYIATLLLTVLIVNFPIIISRLKAEMTLVDAYTQNMAAVFAHLMHYLDTIELYSMGKERESFVSDVQFMLLLFALMGFLSCNTYYVSLFYKNRRAATVLKRFQSYIVMESLEAGKDEALLHYFIWVVFYIDLPYATIRLVALFVHGTRLPSFFVKNIMMMVSVAALMIFNSKNSR